jgi:hypothetical protein
MKRNPGNPQKQTLESMKDWILEFCPGEKGELPSLFCHEGKKVFYKYIDFPRISPLVSIGGLLFFVDCSDAKEADLLYLRHKMTGEQKIGYLIPVKLDKKGNEKRKSKINRKIKPLSDVIIIKYAAGDEEYLHINDFDIFKIVNFIHKK